MTEQEIIQNALDYGGCSKEWFDDKSYVGESTAYDDAHAFYDGAHSRDDEVNHWKESYEELAEIANELQTEKQTLIIENARLSNKWIKCSEQPPKKRDGKIRSDVVLVTLGQCWTAAEYHFGDKRWINMLGERETIEPEYWQEVNLPEDILEKGE